MRSLMRTRAALPRAAAGSVKQALSPIFSMQARHMSIPRPSWDKDLQDLDPEVYKIIQMEQQRQHKGIALIPSENYTTHAVSQVTSVAVPGVFSLRAVFCGAFRNTAAALSRFAAVCAPGLPLRSLLLRRWVQS